MRFKSWNVLYKISFAFMCLGLLIVALGGILVWIAMYAGEQLREEIGGRILTDEPNTSLCPYPVGCYYVPPSVTTELATSVESGASMLGVGILVFIITMPITIIAKGRKNRYTGTVVNIQSQRSRSKLWFLLPIFLAIIGGLIAFFVLRHDDPKKAKNCLYLGIAFTVVGVAFNLLFP